MFQILVLTHGRLGEELLASARAIAGETPNVTALTLEWSDSYEEARAKVQAVLAELDHGEGVLVLTDMYGGTPFNVARDLARPGRVEIVTGVNLPMVVRLSCIEDEAPDLDGGARWILRKARQAICLCTEAPPGKGTPSRD